MNMQRIFRRRLVLPALCLILPAYAFASAPPPWPPELSRAFELYYSGDFLEVQSLCRRLNAQSRDVRLRREAAALDALATMRLEGRDNRLEGQTRLAQLAEQDGALLDRPECSLAYGIAETALFATSSALFHLDRAAAGFEKRERYDRLAAALSASAEAWARHSEWVLSAPGRDIPRPENSVQADAVRIKQIRDIRRRAAELPDVAAWLDQIDLILARRLLVIEGGAEEAVRLLKNLSDRSALSKTAAQAGLVLAKHYETGDRWSEALDLYTRVNAAELGALSEQAERRLRTIREPSLEMKLPRQARPGQTVAVEIATRGLSRVEFELRRVDLIEWLTQRQGRCDEAALPVTGATIAVRDLSPNVERSLDPWSSDSLANPLEFAAQTGAAVALARAVGPDGRKFTVKRLILGGDFQTHAFSGRRNLALWLTAGKSEDAEALLWMRGSFVPTRSKLTDNVALLRFPPEAMLLRDKRWTCIVRAGEHMAWCQGMLPAEHKAERLPALVLTGGPAVVSVGETLHIFGELLDAPPSVSENRPLELQLIDSSERILYAAEMTLSPAATFAVHLPIDASMANQTLRAAALLGGRRLVLVNRSPYVRVRRLDPSPVRLRYDVPDWRDAGDKVLGRLTAEYPWGTAIADAKIISILQPLVLPDNALDQPAFHALSRVQYLELDFAGVVRFAEETASFKLPPGPRAIGLWAECVGWDGRNSTARAGALLAPRPAHLWMAIEEQGRQVGRPLHVQVHWFDPGGRAAGIEPTLSIYRDGERAAKTTLSPYQNFLRSSAWRPAAAGNYELVATLEPRGCAALVARKTITIEPEPAHAPTKSSPLDYRARMTRQAGSLGVDVQLKGAANALLLMLVDAGDPIAARQVAGLDGDADIFIPTSVEPGADPMLLVFDGDWTDARIIGATAIEPAADRAVALTIGPRHVDAALGQNLDLEIDCRRGDQPIAVGTLMARLANITESGGAQWMPGKARIDANLRSDGLRQTSTTTTFRENADVRPILETLEMPAASADALFTGQTVWIDDLPIKNGAAAFSAPIPSEPGIYRLFAVLHTPDGERAVASRDWDLRGGVRMLADLPKQMTLGDHVEASLRITNATRETRRVRVAFDGGPRLHTIGWRLPSGVDYAEQGDEPLVTLSPESTMFLHVRVEAAGAGRGAAAFTYTPAEPVSKQSTAVGVDSTEFGGARHSASVEYVIHDARQESAREERPSLRIQRALYRLTETPSDVHQTDSDGMAAPRDHEPQWDRTEIDPGERVYPGELILVEEVFTLGAPLSRVRWDQRLPANCFTHRGEWETFRQIGRRRDLHLQSVGYDAARLAENTRCMHEYVIVPVRPGVCRFPAPTITAADKPVPAEIESAVQRLIVAEK